MTRMGHPTTSSKLSQTSKIIKVQPRLEADQPYTHCKRLRKSPPSGQQSRKRTLKDNNQWLLTTTSKFVCKPFGANDLSHNLANPLTDHQPQCPLPFSNKPPASLAAPD